MTCPTATLKNHPGWPGGPFLKAGGPMWSLDPPTGRTKNNKPTGRIF